MITTNINVIYWIVKLDISNLLQHVKKGATERYQEMNESGEERERGGYSNDISSYSSNKQFININ